MRFRSPLVEAANVRRSAGFTILEILVAVALFSIILVMTGSIISSSSRAWTQANAKIETFQAARGAFDMMTSRLSRATLNTYWDYYDASGAPFRLSTNAAAFVPARYGRYSDMHFLCGPASALVGSLPSGLSATSTDAVFFVAPTGLSSSTNYSGLPGLLGACGYFVAFGNDDATKPAFPPVPSRYRWRLMEVSAPVEELQVFATPSGAAWSAGPVSQGRVRSVAENVIALVVWPRRSIQDDPSGAQLSTNYSYDSRTTEAWSGTPLKQPVQAHQLPPTVQVTIVAIDEDSARKIENGSTPPAQITAALDGLFDGAVSEYSGDLDTLESRLAEKKIGHRVFTTSIALRESKWSP